jgi:SAM-dependent methyltransferase
VPEAGAELCENSVDEDEAGERVFRHDPESPITLGPQADRQHAAAAGWFATDTGTQLLACEGGVLREWLADRFGYHLIQVGAPPGLEVLAASRILHRCLVDLDGSGARLSHTVLRGRAAALPLESDSVDVVVLPHVLEFEPRPHEALREAARVLVPEGHLFLCALNPYSLMGLWQAMGSRSGRAPWHGRFFSPGRLRDWLALVGLELRSVHGVFYRPPLRRVSVMDRLSFMESLGPHLCPPLAGSFVMGARKRVSRAAPIRPRFAYRPRLVGVSLAGGPPARISDGR